MTTYSVVLTIWQDRDPIVVSETEALALNAQGLVYSSTPALPSAALAGTETIDGGTTTRDDLIQIRSATAAEWATAETAGAVVAADELVAVTDEPALVIGDGTTKVASLPRLGGATIDGGTL